VLEKGLVTKKKEKGERTGGGRQSGQEKRGSSVVSAVLVAGSLHLAATAATGSRKGIAEKAFRGTGEPMMQVKGRVPSRLYWEGEAF